MMSIERQCNEAVDLLGAIQACVDREGWVIPCRAADLEVYAERARQLLGIDYRRIRS